jgi:hypothetical protein
MLEHILEDIQDKLATPIDDLTENGIKPILLNRINQLARGAYKDLKITYFTYDEMAAILETEAPISAYKGDDNVLFTFLKPNVELIDTPDGQSLSIVMSIDFRSTMV